MRRKNLRMMISLMAAVGTWSLTAEPVARLGTDAAVRIVNDDARIGFVIFEEFGNKWLETINTEAAVPTPDAAIAYKFIRKGTAHGAGRATLRANGNDAVFSNDFTAHRDLRGEGIGFILTLRAATFGGSEWSAGDAKGTFPKMPEHSHVTEGTAQKFTFSVGKEKWTLSFADNAKFAIRDRRKEMDDDFAIYFMLPRSVKLKLGAGLSSVCKISSSGGKVKTGVQGFTSVAEGKDWTRLEWIKGVKASSALDFSRAPFRHATAGSLGALKAVDDHFEFARQPGKEARLFGAIVQYNAPFGPKAISQEAVKRLARMGYNAILVTRVDNKLLGDDTRAATADKEQAANLDTFIMLSEKEGLEVYREFCDDRNYTWSQLGERKPKDAEETVPPRLANALMLINDAAFECWREAMMKALARKNTKNVKNCLADSGTQIFATLVHGSLLAAWSDLAKLDSIKKDYTAWLAAKRKEKPNFMEGEVCEPFDVGVVSVWAKKGASIREYLSEKEGKGLERQREELRKNKMTALFAVHPSALWFEKYELMHDEVADATFTHFSIDSPKQLGEKYAPPWRLRNINPLPGDPLPGAVGWMTKKKIPFGIAGWNMPPPSKWRSGIGLYIGARAARDGWDAVWHDNFASDFNSIPEGKGQALDFQYANDPMTLATERAVLSLYARGDFMQAEGEKAFQLRDGGITIVTPRTAGAFVAYQKGTFNAGPLEVKTEGGEASVWVSSLTDKPIEKSSRLLLTHLTDMQRSGSLYDDTRKKMLIRMGTGPVVVKNGTAEITLSVENAARCAVYALKSDGTRMCQIKTKTEDGKICFTATVKGSKGAQYIYEILK